MRFLTHKRTLGRKYVSEQAELRLLVRFAEPACTSTGSTSSPRRVLDDFLASRPRPRPRSFNHLLGVVRGLLDWAVTYEMLPRLAAAHPATPRHHGADPVRVRRRRGRVACSRPQPRCRTTRARLQRGPTYRAIFALCYGLGLRAGEACGLRLGDVDVAPRSAGRARRQVRQDPARPARPTHRRADRRAARAPPRRRCGAATTRRCSASTGAAACTRAPPARCSITW